MLIIRGTNVFPTQIEEVLVDMMFIQPHYQLVIRRENFRDTLEIKVETTNGFLADNLFNSEKIRNEVEKRVHIVLGLKAKVTLLPPKSIERFQGKAKAKRILDLRYGTEQSHPV